MDKKYEEILYLDHPKSLNHKPMSLYDRAAQFAPFHSLTGYDKLIKEANKETYSLIELSNEQIEMINYKLSYLKENELSENIEITYFIKDDKKQEGIYCTYCGKLLKIDEVNKKLYFENNTCIEFKNIISIQSPTLKQLFDDSL